MLSRKFLKEIRTSITNPDEGKTPHIMIEDILKKYTDIYVSTESQIQGATLTDMKFTGAERREITRKIGSKTCKYSETSSCQILSLLLKHHEEAMFVFAEQCLLQGIIPVNIKKARINLIPKADEVKLRPLSILHPLYRFFDACLYTALMRHIDVNKFECQYGYLPERGIIDMHIEWRRIRDEISRADKPSPWIFLSMDLTNAFEEISYRAIIRGLEAMNVPSYIQLLVLRLLRNRQSYIDHGVKRYWKTHLTGTPQGGFCSPILFIVGLREIERMQTPDFRIYCFADDISIIAKGE